jgi:haloalkane dehalogenase
MNKPNWLNETEYPFKSNFIDLDMGKMHYIDEGEGGPIVMIHGNPTWSYLYRHLIKGLSEKYRCIAMDHIGFGLSDKPESWSYKPEDHARNLEILLEKLNLKSITLVGQDWGGPIGLSYAVNNPEKVKSLVIMNTWMWSAKGDPHFEKFSGFMGGTVGRFLIKNFNFFASTVMKKAYGNVRKLTPEIHDHYKKALPTKMSRKGSWVFPKEIIGSTEWVNSLWEKRDAIKDKPTKLIWGMKDIAFRENELKKWEELFSNSSTIRLEHVGHYVQEEMGAELCPVIEDFLKSD